MYMYLYMYKEHYKNTQFEYVTKLKKKSFQILMVKRVLKNKIMADIFSAIWRCSRSKQRYTILQQDRFQTIFQILPKFLYTIQVLQIGKLFILYVGFEICWIS